MIGAGLTLVTGNTGSGKTALVVKMMQNTPGRPLFVMGIPELKLEHFKCPPVEEWTEMRPDPDDPSLLLPYFTFPPNSIVVVDEAQRIFRPRPVGSKVPEYVAAFETRRHIGTDFVLLTQAPGFVDSHIRKLVKRHIHIHETTLGKYKLEWTGLGDPEAPTSRELAQREKYSPPKEVFGLYKSAELHTKEVKKRPLLVYAFVPMVAALIGGGFYVKNRMDDRMGPQSAPVATNQPGQKPMPQGSVPPGQKSAPLTAAQYIAQFEPRIDGLPHTAPAYDEVTKPAEAPEPVGCIDSPRTGCKCYTQQGTEYKTTEAICKQIMNSGIYLPWKKTHIARNDSPSKASDTAKPGRGLEPSTPADRLDWIQTADMPTQLSETKKAGSS